MALFGPHAVSDLSPLSGEEQKSDFGSVRSGPDFPAWPPNARW